MALRPALSRLGAAGLLVVLGAATAGATETIRVAVLENVRTVELRGFDVAVVPLADGAGGPDPGPCPACPRMAAWRSDTVRATAGPQGVEIDGRQAVGFRLVSERPIRLNGREYPGRIDLVRNGGGLAVVNELPLEDYLVGVLRAETPERWPLEALRAQAIVARTYAAYHRLLNAGKPYHVVASSAHQNYAGLVPLSSPVWDAVRDTAGVVLLWEGEVFPAFYHAESGGYTEDPRTVFAAPNMPALRPIRCVFSANSPHFYWNLDLRLADLAETLRRNGIDVGAIARIDVAERTPSLRAVSVTVHGSRGAVRLRGNDFRRMIGYDVLKSTLFAVAVDGQIARFSGRGYGHGVGLCQWGARGMAEQGFRAPQILEYYYPGATLGTLNGRP